jgi:hypothetical protein
MIVRKVLVRPGKYTAPMARPDGTRVQGEVAITPDRVKRWAEQFRAMKAAGLRVPVCWGHQPGALPGAGLDRAGKQAAVAQANAGYLEEMSLDPDDGLAGTIDVPGATVEGGSLVTEHTLADGRKVKSAIKEVSVAIRDWTDGSGRKWEDAIVHVALVTHPVMGGQEGFESAEMATGDENGRLYEREVAGGGRRLLILMGTEEQTMPEMTAPVTPGTTTTDPRASRALQVLASFGLHLPEDTHDGNLCERIDLCGNAILKDRATRGDDGGGMDDGLGDDEFADDDLGDPLAEDGLDDGLEEVATEDDEFADDDGLEDGDGDEEMTDDLGDGEGDEDTDEVSGDSDDMPEEEEDEDAEEEPRPMLMSTGGGDLPAAKPGKGKQKPAGKLGTPMERALAAEMVKSVQAARKAKLAKLVSQGLPRAQAQELFGKIDRSKVRLQRKGEKVAPVTETVDIELSTIEGVFASGVVAPPQKGKRARRPTEPRNMEDDP